jgi:ABC-type glycerol-3-phosphate transport system permease component
MKLPTIVGRSSWSFFRILLTVIFIVPFFFIILLSFRSMTDIYTNPLGFHGHWIPQNYSQAWGGPPGGTGFSHYARNSGLVACISVTLAAIIGSLAAHFTSLLAPHQRRRLMMIPLVATIVPAIALLIPFFQIFNAWGLLSKPAALGVVYAGLCLPTTILVLHAFFVEFPSELLEAASLDGLGHFATFRRIVLPLSISPLVAISLLNVIWVWGETQVGLVLMQAPGSQTIPVGVLTFQSAFFANLGPVFAGLTLATVPMALIYLAFHRVVNRGISLGGVLH